MGKDPNKLNPPPRGHMSWGAFIIWCIVVGIGLAALANRDQQPDPNDITPVPPSQSERR